MVNKSGLIERCDNFIDSIKNRDYQKALKISSDTVYELRSKKLLLNLRGDHLSRLDQESLDTFEESLKLIDKQEFDYSSYIVRDLITDIEEGTDEMGGSK